MSKVYLAGPISGLSYDQAANGWRHTFPLLVDEIDGYHDVEFVSPMRGKEFLKNMVKLGHDPAEMNAYKNPMGSPSGIVTRDSYDVRTCDLMVVNFLDATAVSIGTVLEIGMAFDARKPIVAVVPEGDHPHNHGMLLAMVQANGCIVHSLEEAALLTYHMLTGRRN